MACVKGGSGVEEMAYILSFIMNFHLTLQHHPKFGGLEPPAPPFSKPCTALCVVGQNSGTVARAISAVQAGL